MNGGWCANLPGGYSKCRCKRGYTGTKCELREYCSIYCVISLIRTPTMVEMCPLYEFVLTGEILVVGI